MMQRHRLFVRQFCITFVMMCIIAGAVVLSIQRYLNTNEEQYYNKARVLVADDYQTILTYYSNQSDTKLEKKISYPCCLVDLRGNVMINVHNTYYEVGETINLAEILNYDYSFSKQHKEVTKVTFPVVVKQTTVAYVIFFLPINQIWQTSKLERAVYIVKPIIIAVILVSMYLVYHLIELKVKIFNPIGEISESAKAIIEGNYDREVRKLNKQHLTKDEVENLTYGFELMRDELKERIRTEERLKKSQKELISCISHDLKTPISTIEAYSEGIRDGIANTPDKLTRYADVIAMKTKVLTHMISDLLDHSNAELNELTIYKEEVYFRLFMKRIFDEMEPYVMKKNIRFTYELLQENLLVMMDERRITQVLYNLVENAMKYMDKENGKVHVYTGYEPDKKQVCITVRDNGRGISIEDIPYVFDKFYRGEKSRNMSIPGCGLGLSICRYIVEQHGGEITCKSTKDIGTEFTFTIRA